jgi:hypothetical protein
MDSSSQKATLTEELEDFSRFSATCWPFTTYYSWWTRENTRHPLPMAHNVLQEQQGRDVFAP